MFSPRDSGRRPRRRFGLLVRAVFLTGIGLAIPARGQSPKVQIEKKPKYLPAGPGEAPWNVTRHTIPIRKIRSGGPPKDGIPALTHPAFLSAAEANRVLQPAEFVLGVAFDGVAKAYPIRILNWHEIVNDDVGRQPVLVTW